MAAEGLAIGHCAGVAFSLDGQPDVRDERCSSCGRTYQWITARVLRDGNAFAVYFAQCHDHADGGEAWLDIVVGSWDGPKYSDHATFSCRVTEAGAGAVDAPVASKGAASFTGAKLDRSAALADPRIGDVWAVVDFVVTTDPTVSAYVYGSA